MEKTLTGCFLAYFGKKEGQSMSDFSNEVKQAVAAGRDFWVSEFTRVGFKITDA